MPDLTCPGCGEPMDTRQDPDLVLDVCPACDGVFLDAGELNDLVTGMAGDVEALIAPVDAPEEKIRSCPRCDGGDMRKVQMLEFSGVVLDHCPACGGVFLDAGELDELDEALADEALRPDGEEWRGMRDGRLVRLDRIAGVDAGTMVLQAPTPNMPDQTWADSATEELTDPEPGAAVMESPWEDAGTRPTGGSLDDGSAGNVIPRSAVSRGPRRTTGYRLTVFYKGSMMAGLRISRDRWGVILARIAGLFKEIDIKTGDDDFDGQYLVQGDDHDTVVSLVTEAVRAAVRDVCENPPELAGRAGRIEVLDNRVVATFDPEPQAALANIEEEIGPPSERLAAVAAALEAAKEQS